ncbi:ROK family protein [Pontibacter sp. E15-1]|uniref:ROK family protein n=1 Tax=Pontibacter sp. E15-1 TaxID=2919918 RepID=UPI001F4FF957|nr:ROK family protein [Pontibacter sp. E15-1]MCJ8164296.1 ROK family protein [Pontibacter sp. E15-1]
MKTFDSSRNLWGIDMGGTKMEGVILKSAQEPKVIFRDRVPTEADQGYEHIMNQVNKLVDKMENAARYKPGHMGIGTPGIYVPKLKIIKNCNATALNGQPLKDDLEKLLGIKLHFANDANCFALAETQLGVVKQKFPDAKIVFGVILGTGVGGGVVVNGEVLNGRHGIGGEWGHNYLPGYEGELCFCGKTGCNESVLAGPALERYYAKQTGVKRSMKDIVALADAGVDEAAQKTLDRLIEGFALAISVIINTLDPDVIVIGGGLGNIDRVYRESVALIIKHVLDNTFEAPVVKPLLGDSAGVFGAAFLAAAASADETVTKVALEVENVVVLPG